MFYSYFQYFSFAVPLFVVVIIVGGGGEGGVEVMILTVEEVQVRVAVRWWYYSSLYRKLCVHREMHEQTAKTWLLVLLAPSFNLNSNAIRIALCFWLLSVCYFILSFVSTCTYIRGAYLTVRKYKIKSNCLGNGRDWLDYVCTYA